MGEGLAGSESTKLTLYGENEAGNKTCISYIFKKQDSITMVQRFTLKSQQIGTIRFMLMFMMKPHQMMLKKMQLGQVLK